MTTLTITVPTEAMAGPLRAAHPAARVVVWAFDGPAPIDHIDLAVFPYMERPEALAALGAAARTIVQGQTLGFDGVDTFLPPDSTYCNAVGVHEGATAEHALGMVLSAQRGLPQFTIDQVEHRWAPRQTRGLLGLRVLVIGVGGVGTEIAARLAPFDIDLVRVARTARTDARGEIHAEQDLPVVLRSCDVVIVAVPFTTATRGLVDREFLAAMKEDALLVNVSRGPVVRTDDLVEALSSGRIRAAVDVTDPEPLPPDHPLWAVPNLIITPHVGGDVASMADRIGRVVDEQIQRLRDALTPINAVIGPVN